MKRDPTDRRQPERLAGSFLASLILHAIAALLLISVATSSSEQSSPESFIGGAVVTVSSRAAIKSAPAPAKHAALPAPHAVRAPRPQSAQRRSAPPHPRVLHELAKFAPTAPPNPTPVPIASAAPNPAPTQPQLTVTPAPLVAAVPVSVPTAAITAVSVKTPPTAAPVPRPSVAPVTPAPQPTQALTATAAPLVALTTPRPLVTPGPPTQIHVAERRAPGVPSPGPTSAPAPKQQRGTAPSPGPRPVASAGTSGTAPVKSVAPPRPVQAPPATPRPGPGTSSAKSKRAKTLNERLQSLIPTGAPTTPEPPKRYRDLSRLAPTPEPEPTPPPQVVAATKYIYEEHPEAQRWKLWPLGPAPEERYVKMYVTSIKRVGFVTFCTGWVVRAPIAGSSKWIVETNETYVCAGRLQPFTPSSPPPAQP